MSSQTLFRIKSNLSQEAVKEAGFSVKGPGSVGTSIAFFDFAGYRKRLSEANGKAIESFSSFFIPLFFVACGEPQEDSVIEAARAVRAVAQDKAGNKRGRQPVLAVVAHEDDDLLFLSPTLLQYLRHDHPIRIIYMTAGDAGLGGEYWQMREHGVRQAYDVALGSKKKWQLTQISAGGHQWSQYTRHDKKKSLQLIFLRLPDGNVDGSGFTNHRETSLQKLWQGSRLLIAPIDRDFSLTRGQIIATLADFEKSFAGQDESIVLHTLNCEGDSKVLKDHSDHRFSALFALAAQQTVYNADTVYLHWGYDSLVHLENISEGGSLQKWLSFGAYAEDDTDLNRVLPMWRRKSLYQKMRRREFAWHAKIEAYQLTSAGCLTLDRMTSAAGTPF